ncbi:DNA-binding protein [Oscillatoria sp. CS-180]|uniref:DNA-binding protein n=1 Tax=Oscillatoria sp. CS-180 TaxID=3021720 RepID=UPI00232CB1B4|nr:DNA-binding protein [Oscillatoria sp. CS-180]MDB9525218.1 DNA-binding protein [Oscillatoria sp. CS-180]
MATITITLADDQLAQLKAIATQQGVTVESLIQTKIATLVNQPQPSFQEASDYVLQKNAALYQRLA